MGFQQGLSGLNAAARNLEVIGNNVANSGTFGTKVSRAEFSDVYASAIGGTSTSGASASQVGIGVAITNISQQFTPGNITSTGTPMDLAIDGNGFFQLANSSGTLVYTRNGQFKLDRNGSIVSNNGSKLLGYQADDQGAILQAQASPLQLPISGTPPRTTDQVNLAMTFDSRAAPASGATLDLENPATYNFATSQTIYDVQGQNIGLTYYMRKTSAHNWDMYVTANGTSLQTDGAGDPFKVASITFPSSGGEPTTEAIGPLEGEPGTVTTYDSSGTPLATTGSGIFDMPDIPALTLSGGGLSEIISGISINVSSSVEYGSGFSVTNLSQTGFPPGKLNSVTIESNGVVLARYSNGQTKAAGQVELAAFRNPQGLQPLGSNEWGSTYASGQATNTVAGDSNMGLLLSGSLEESNIDLTSELVKMIVAQRTYQANAQTIKTEDQLLQTLVNIR
jgi:flagellar hook protein FlgE